MLSLDCRLFFKSLLNLLWLAHEHFGLAHGALDWGVLLLRCKWETGKQFELVLDIEGDTGCLQIPGRKYVDRTTGSAPATAQNNSPQLLHSVSRETIAKIMCSSGDVGNTLKRLSIVTQISNGKRLRTFSDQDTFNSLQYGQAYDVYSVASMMLEIHRDKEVTKSWQKNLKKLDSTPNIIDFFRASFSLDWESVDIQILNKDASLLQGMLRTDFKNRSTAQVASQHDFFALSA